MQEQQEKNGAAFFENIQRVIVEKINQSKESLKIAVTWFTNHEIFDALLKRIDNSNYKVELIVLNDCINNKKEGLNFQNLIEKSGHFYYSDVENMVHNKFCIVDDKLVITGSYNWTYYAEDRNWENVVVLEDYDIVQSYISEFEKIVNRHERIKNVREKALTKTAVDNDNYLVLDYFYQAKKEMQKGNDLEAAKIYNESLRLNNSQTEILVARNKILEKYNSHHFEVNPVEIGIQFKSGYEQLIAAFEALPATVNKIGHSSSENQKKYIITIKKNDVTPTTIMEIPVTLLKAYPEGAPIIEVNVSLSKAGVLTVRCREVDTSNKKTRQLTINEYHKV